MIQPTALEIRLGRLFLLLSLVIGFYLRLRGVGSEALFGDELHTVEQVGASLGTILTHFDSYGSHVVLPLLQHLSLGLFGSHAWAFRLVAILPGLLTLLLIYPIGRRLVGRVPALIATLALALSPMHIYYSRFARSYALSTLLALLLVHCLARALEAESRLSARRHWLAAFGLAALLPYVHLSSAGFVGVAALIAVGLSARANGWRSGLRVLAGFGVALALCLAAFAPIWDQLLAYLNDAMPASQKKHPSGVLGIVILLAGSVPGAFVLIAGLPLALGGLSRKRLAPALLMAASVLGPSLALLITRPHGMEYAYARYLLVALPFLPLLLGWGLWALAGRLFGGGLARFGFCIGTASLLFGASFGLGPSFGPRPACPLFDNSYLSLHRLPAFDAPWPGHHSFYDKLAKEPVGTRIVEYPILQTRAVLMYRQAAFVHGQDVLLGYPIELPAGMDPKLYVNIQKVDAEDADYILLHRDPVTEVKSYWQFVFGVAGPEDQWGTEFGFLKRHRMHLAAQRITSTEFLASEAARLRNRLGPAFYKDAELLVWKLNG